MRFKNIKLADGRQQIVPAQLEILNPEREGEAKCLYFIWRYDPAEGGSPASLEEALQGSGMHRPFGFFTDCADLWKTGRHDTPMQIGDFTAAVPDFLQLTESMIELARREVPNGRPWAFAYALCDCAGSEVPVGTSEAFCFTGGSHE